MPSNLISRTLFCSVPVAFPFHSLLHFVFISKRPILDIIPRLLAFVHCSPISPNHKLNISFIDISIPLRSLNPGRSWMGFYAATGVRHSNKIFENEKMKLSYRWNLFALSKCFWDFAITCYHSHLLTCVKNRKHIICTGQRLKAWGNFDCFP